MAWLNLIHTMLTAALLTVVNRCLACGIQQTHPAPAATHTPILALISLLLFSSASLVIYVQPAASVLTASLLGIFWLALLAQADTLTGRIPVFFLAGAVGIGLYAGILQGRIGAVLAGGLLNLVLAIVVYFSGQAYSHHGAAPFGFGDVYASGAVGFLLGFPLSLWGLVGALLLSLVGAGLMAWRANSAFLSVRVRLGFYFFIAAFLPLCYQAVSTLST